MRHDISFRFRSLFADPIRLKGHYMANHGKFSGSGFKTVTVAIPGCRVQRFRVCVGNRPEDIQKWIADRKKRFPRRSQAEQNKTNVDSSRKEIRAAEAPEQTTGLSSLLGGYGSSSESEDETPKTREEEKKDNTLVRATPPLLPEASETEKNTNFPTAKRESSMGFRPCRYFMRNGKCLNGDACRFSHDMSNQPRRKLESMKRKRGKSSSNDTLLRKLLSNDVDREETLALQLLENIFDSNFFDGDHGKQKRHGGSR